MFVASAPAHASLAARQIVDELRHQYILAFEASRSREGWRPLEVRARDGALTVRARAGYVSGTAQTTGDLSSRLTPSHGLTRSLGNTRPEAKMKKLVIAAPILALALGGTTACATKKMVQDAGRRSQRKGRNALEVRRGNAGANACQRRTDRRSRSEGAGCRAARRRGGQAC